MSRTKVYPPQVTRACDTCDKLFQPSMRDVMLSKGRFCSRICTWEFFRRKPRSIPKVKMVSLVCSNCSIEFFRPQVNHCQSKSGLHFCTRRCKGVAQSNYLLPSSRYIDGSSSYRTFAFRCFGKKCNRCGYDKYADVLRVHHKDRNHKNNDKSNLEVLCPTCHDEEHYLAKDGFFTGWTSSVLIH